MNASELFGELCIRADARPDVGIGHLMRCLALAQAWQDRGGTASFVTATASPALLKRLDSEGFAVHRLQAESASPADAAETGTVASSRGAAWVVVDGYPFGPGYLQGLIKDDRQLMVIDDQATQDFAAARLIVNPNVQATPELYPGVNGDSRVLAGSRYALLRREFQGNTARKKSVAQQTRPRASERNLPDHVVITMGGSDPPNATRRMLEILAGFGDRRLQLTVILGPAYAHRESLEPVLTALRGKHDVELLVDPHDLVTVLARADLAISAAGTTCWELASLGVPLAIVVLADNQVAGAEALAQRGTAVFLGWHKDLDAGAVLQQLQSLFEQPGLLRRLSDDGRSLIDGLGAGRVAERMATYPLALRAVTDADAAMLHEWANDALTRRMSFSAETIPWESHVVWLRRRLADADCRFHVVQDAHGQPLGQARLDRFGSRATLSFGLAPTARGQGFAARLVRLAAVDSLLAGWCQHVDAWVRPENVPSLAAFRRAGFTKRGVAPDQDQPEQSQGDALLFSLP
jgi:UDP-2,4-diacetamido-2,4,6-trideoxy-beta-L-altropyranose hydrolase